MDKQKQHYKVKIIPLILAVVFGVGYGILFYLGQKEVDEKAAVDNKYSGSVEGKFKSYCEGERQEAKCDTGIEQEVDGKTYLLKLGNDAIATKDDVRIVRYDPNNPADAISGGTDRNTTVSDLKEEYITKKYKKSIPRVVLILTIIFLADAFFGYYIDKVAESARKSRQKIIDTEADLADKQKNSKT